MKLIDILARELKEWPEDAKFFTQDDDGDLNRATEEGVPEVKLSGTWAATPGHLCICYDIKLSEVAEDCRTAVVTREQWQAAVAALATPEWDGTGLPPVGTVCGFCRLPETPGCEWTKVIIVAHWSEGLANPVAIFMSTSYAPQADQAAATCFRPIRTAEQIATEEALADIESLYGEGGPAAVYGAGYRKVRP